MSDRSQSCAAKTGKIVALSWPRGKREMDKSRKLCLCIPECRVAVPAELGSVGLCVSHFTLSVEKACADMHREIALCELTAERGTEVATYIGECALLLARLVSSRCLSDELRKRILCSFVSLMNLRENLDRSAKSRASELLLRGGLRVDSSSSRTIVHSTFVT